MQQTMNYLPVEFCNYVTYGIQHASNYLKTYSHLLTWRGDNKEMIADIGCANGAITTDVLLPFCGDKVGEIIGFDVSTDMLEAAGNRNTKSNVSFRKLDIAEKITDVDLPRKFHHVFSFYCLHMVPDQKRCAVNIFAMLKPGGEAFLTFLIVNTRIQSWFALCQREKWSKYLRDFPDTFSKYIGADDAQGDFEETFRQVGFSVESYKTERMVYAFENRTEFENSIIKPCMLTSYVPEHLKGELENDLLDLMTKLCKKGDSYEMFLQAVVAVARKPLN